MCWVLYLAADRPLPLWPFDPKAPALNIAELSPDELRVRRQFSKPFVYSVGAHTQCGCGFDRGQANADLRNYLAAAVSAAGSLELLACWDGDQAAEPDNRWARRLSDFHERMDWFPDRTFIELT